MVTQDVLGWIERLNCAGIGVYNVFGLAGEGFIGRIGSVSASS